MTARTSTPFRHKTPSDADMRRRIVHVIDDHTVDGVCWLGRVELIERFGRGFIKYADQYMREAGIKYDDQRHNKYMPFGPPAA